MYVVFLWTYDTDSRKCIDNHDLRLRVKCIRYIPHLYPFLLFYVNISVFQARFALTQAHMYMYMVCGYVLANMDGMDKQVNDSTENEQLALILGIVLPLLLIALFVPLIICVVYRRYLNNS